MPQGDLDKFREALKANEALRAELSAVAGRAEGERAESILPGAVALASQHGYSFTSQELGSAVLPAAEAEGGERGRSLHEILDLIFDWADPIRDAE